MMTKIADIDGTAALSICESLLLSLSARNVLPEREIVGILKDAAAAHEDLSPNDDQQERHAAVAAVIRHMMDGGTPSRDPG